MDDRLIKVIITSIAGVLTVLLFLVIIFTVEGVRAEKECLELGYPRSSIAWNLEKYCIARVNQTDIVVPLATAPRRR